MQSTDAKPFGLYAGSALCVLVLCVLVLCMLVGCRRVDPPDPGAAPARPAGNTRAATDARAASSSSDTSAAASLTDASFDFTAYRRISSSPMKVSVAGSEHPMRTATRSVLDRLDLPPGEHIPLPKKLNTRAGGDGQANVLVTYTDLKDDAVTGRRYLLRMYAYQRNWIFNKIGVQYRCRRGPEGRRQYWSKESCP